MVVVARTCANFLVKFLGGLDFWNMEEKIFELVRSKLANLAKLKHSEKVYEIRKLANFANFV